MGFTITLSSGTSKATHRCRGPLHRKDGVGWCGLSGSLGWTTPLPYGTAIETGNPPQGGGGARHRVRCGGAPAVDVDPDVGRGVVQRVMLFISFYAIAVPAFDVWQTADVRVEQGSAIDS